MIVYIAQKLHLHPLPKNLEELFQDEREKKKKKGTKNSSIYKETTLSLTRKNTMLDNHQWSREVTLMKVSSGQGIVKPPIG